MSLAPHVATDRSLVRNERGNVGIIFALVALPVFGIVGMAVDYGRTITEARRIQFATDAAAMAAASAQFKTEGERQQIAIKVFRTNFGRVDQKNAATPTVRQEAGLTTVSASSSVPMTFMRIMNFENVTVEGLSQVSTAGKKLEVALMFDVTGSMTDPTAGGTSSKIEDAKAAAVDLLDIVMPEGSAHNTRLSLVPFSQRVKLDTDTMVAVTGQPAVKQIPQTTTATKTTYTLSTTDFDWKKLDKCIDRLRDDLYAPQGKTQSAAEVAAEAMCLTFETRGKNKKTEYKTPEIVEGTQKTTSTTYSAQYIKPCVIERNTGNFDRKTGEAAPASGEWPATYSATLTANASCPPNGSNGAGTLIPLTDDRDRVLKAINALETGGSTAGQIGTAWSWYTISPEWASIWKSASRPGNYGDNTLIKAAILMTDGAYNSCNDSSTWCAASATQAVEICNKMKAQGIQVWTIGFGMSTNPSDPARQTLVKCADNGRYYFPYNRDELRQAFSVIGRALSDASNEPQLVN